MTTLKKPKASRRLADVPRTDVDPWVMVRSSPAAVPGAWMLFVHDCIVLARARIAFRLENVPRGGHTFMVRESDFRDACDAFKFFDSGFADYMNGRVEERPAFIEKLTKERRAKTPKRK